MITIILLAVGLAVSVFGFCNWKPSHMGSILGVSVTGLVLCSAGLIVALALVAETNLTKEIDYLNCLYEKQVIEYRVANKESNTVGNEMLYNDIVEFNNELRSIKKWSANPWTNVFYNDKIAEIDYIEF